ncbi:hypothetical protein D3C84_887810 [compost metagenome]
MLSNNVVGALACEPTTSVAAISVCHINGQKSTRTAVVLKNADGTEKCVVAEGEDCVETIGGSTFPTASTGSGQVTQQYPDAVCSQGETASVAEAQAPEPEEEP